MDQERRSQREMMQENEKQARTTYTKTQVKSVVRCQTAGKSGNVPQ